MFMELSLGNEQKDENTMRFFNMQIIYVINIFNIFCPVQDSMPASDQWRLISSFVLYFAAWDTEWFSSVPLLCSIII